jgi:hypothetical protein
MKARNVCRDGHLFALRPKYSCPLTCHSSMAYPTLLRLRFPMPASPTLKDTRKKLVEQFQTLPKANACIYLLLDWVFSVLPMEMAPFPPATPEKRWMLHPTALQDGVLSSRAFFLL